MEKVTAEDEADDKKEEKKPKKKFADRVKTISGAVSIDGVIF